MPDAHTQSLVRQAAAGDVGAEAALLRARVRAGELCQEQVELAAWCGCLRSRASLGWTCCCGDGDGDGEGCGNGLTLVRWLIGLQALARKWVTGERECEHVIDDHPGAEITDIACGTCKGIGKVFTTAEEPVMARAAVAAAWEVLETWEEENACPHDGHHASDAECTGASEVPREALEAVETWIADPTEEHREVCSNLVQAGMPGSTWHLLMALADWPKRIEHWTGSIQCAATEAQPQAVREATCARVVRFAFGLERVAK